MKKFVLVPFIVFLLIIFGVGWFVNMVLPASGNTSYKNFLIESGMSAGQIGASLESQHFIKSALAFKIYVQFTGLSGKIQAGEYRISSSFNLLQIAGVLTKGPVEVWVTIPEGFRREEVAAKVTTSLDQDAAFASGLLSASNGEEGYLFPDTYLFPKESSASSIVNEMRRNFDAKTSKLSAGSGLTFDQRIILASIIERETKTPEERAMVAGILVNRLNAGVALQVDASVQYAVASARCPIPSTKCNWWQPLTASDLEIDSPYNTYKFPGLPPTPIANPGFSSIQAAFSPAETDYFYYLHGKDGQIRYAKTLEEQNANIQKYL